MTKNNLLIGPVILDLLGTELSQEEHDILQHPQVGGVILFSRNYESPPQITELCKSIRKTRSTPLLITVDQEGGRVQRFRHGFTRLPSMGQLGQLYEQTANNAIQLAEYCGWLMAAELLAVGVDFSLAPVLDLNKQKNTVIGDRSFHQDIDIVITLAKAMMRGMNSAGMIATGKHFPGHGSVMLDSHIAMPIDERNLTEVMQIDAEPFKNLIQNGIQAIMPAHILFSAIDKIPVGFSKYWLQDILRKQLQFTGVIMSDDLNMEGASLMGDYPDRAQAALQAGCDMVLICNNRNAAVNILDKLPRLFFMNETRFQTLQGKCGFNWTELQASSQWKMYNEILLRNIFIKQESL